MLRGVAAGSEAPRPRWLGVPWQHRTRRPRSEMSKQQGRSSRVAAAGSQHGRSRGATRPMCVRINIKLLSWWGGIGPGEIFVIFAIKLTTHFA